MTHKTEVVHVIQKLDDVDNDTLHDLLARGNIYSSFQGQGDQGSLEVSSREC